jgi:pre-rRNA-processing protein TSR3
MDLDILIVRDPRESPQKCSLLPLKGMAGVRFVNHRKGLDLDVGARILLDPEGAEIGPNDRGVGLLVLDSSWRHLAELRRSVRGELRPRRLPPLETAYPRKSKVFADPANGLASIEALYAAIALLDRPRPELLAHYRWAADFLARNAARLPPA